MARSPVFKSFIKLFSWTVAAQLITFSLAPIIARIYNPEQFGEFGVVLSIISTISVVLNGRYEMAITLPQKNRDAINLIAGCFLIGTVISVIVFLITISNSQFLLDLSELKIAWYYLLLIPLVLIFQSIQKPLNYWLIRNREFSKAGTNKIFQAIGFNIIALLLGWLGYTSGLLIAFLAGWVCMAVATYIQSYKTGFRIFSVKFAELREQLLTYKKFPINNAIPALITAFASILGILIVNKYYNLEEAGFYYNTRLYILTPISIITMTLSNVYLERMSALYKNKEKIMPEVKRLAKVLFPLSLLGVVIILLIGPDLFSLVFGSNWEQAGVYSQIVIFGFATQFFVTPFANILFAVNKTNYTIYFPIAYILLMSSLFFLKDLPINSFLGFLSLFEVIAYSIFFLIILKAVINHDKIVTNGTS